MYPYNSMLALGDAPDGAITSGPPVTPAPAYTSPPADTVTPVTGLTSSLKTPQGASIVTRGPGFWDSATIGEKLFIGLLGLAALKNILR